MRVKKYAPICANGKVMRLKNASKRGSFERIPGTAAKKKKTVSAENVKKKLRISMFFSLR